MIRRDSHRLIAATARMIGGPVTLALTLATSAMAQQSLPRFVLEPASGTAFPIELETPEGRHHMHRLAGTGIRTKTFFKVRVYAFGLYLDAEAAADTLAPFKGFSAEELDKSKTFLEQLCRGDFGKSLRIVMSREVSGKDMVEALEAAIAPRLKRAGQKLGRDGRYRDLRRFRKLLDVDRLDQGTELVFTWLPGATLVVELDGRVRGRMESPALCWALFDVYLGQKPISRRARKTAISRIPDLLAIGLQKGSRP